MTVSPRALVAAEVRRCLSRRLVVVLMGLALLASIVTGVVSFVNTSAPGEVGAGHSPLKLVDLWQSSDNDGILLAVVMLLLFGALLGGASVVGAEWRYGTIESLLTFEPRRVRVALAKIGTTAVTAMAIAAALIGVFVLALTPTLVFHGTTDGADAAWLLTAVEGLARGIFVVGLAATLAASVSLATRNTAAALVGVLVYLQILERAAIAWKPWLSLWAITENVGTFVTWAPLAEADRSPAPGDAALRLTVYVGVIAAAAVWSFRRRDVLGRS